MIKTWSALAIRFRIWLLRRAVRALEKRFLNEHERRVRTERAAN